MQISRGTQKQKSKLSELTAREREILHQVSQGLTNNQIADKLNICRSTVMTHITNIYEKFIPYLPIDTQHSVMRLNCALIYLKEKGLLKEDR